jgi:hypothetical protein
MANALRQQDWFTVVLEVLIVVVGILLGLRVDDWNQARRDRATEAAYIERLLVDTANNVEQVELRARSYLDRADSLERIAAAIDSGRVGQIAADDLTRAFCYWYIPESVRLQSATYDEMTATGGLELLRDQRVLHNLQLAWAENERWEAEVPILSAVQMDLARPLRAFTEWRFGAPRQTIDDTSEVAPIRAGCVVDTAALAANTGVSSILVQLNRSQTILGNLLLNEQQALEALLSALREAQAD